MSDEKIKVTMDDIEGATPSAPIVISLGEDETCGKSGNSKKLLWLGGVAAILIACFIGFSVFYFSRGASIQNQQRHAIETVLQRDKGIAKDIPHGEAVEVVSMVVQRMRSINLSECPEEFQEAYQRHTEAWAKTIPILKQAEEQNGFGNFLKSFVIGLIAGCTDQFHLVVANIIENVSASEELKQAAQQVDAEIKETYYNVLRIAQKYKVDTSPYVNNGN